MRKGDLGGKSTSICILEVDGDQSLIADENMNDGSVFLQE